DVGPLDQVEQRSGIESEVHLRGVGDETGAGDVVRVEELSHTLGAVGLACLEVFLIFGSEKGTLMMIEPPGDFGRRPIFEVDDRIFSDDELAFVEECSGSMHEAVKGEGVRRLDAFAMEAHEQGCGAGSVETFIVVKNSA